jgi:hypothetical protein
LRQKAAPGDFRAALFSKRKLWFCMAGLHASLVSSAGTWWGARMYQS